MWPKASLPRIGCFWPVSDHSMWAACVSTPCVSTLCVSTLCVSTLCRSTLCVTTRCEHSMCEQHVWAPYVRAPCLSTLCVSSLCVSTLCVTTLCVSTLCVGTLSEHSMCDHSMWALYVWPLYVSTLCVTTLWEHSMCDHSMGALYVWALYVSTLGVTILCEPSMCDHSMWALYVWPLYGSTLKVQKLPRKMNISSWAGCCRTPKSTKSSTKTRLQFLGRMLQRQKRQKSTSFIVKTPFKSIAEHRKVRELPRKMNIEEVEAPTKYENLQTKLVLDPFLSRAPQTHEKYENYHEKWTSKKLKSRKLRKFTDKTRRRWRGQAENYENSKTKRTCKHETTKIAMKSVRNPSATSI